MRPTASVAEPCRFWIAGAAMAEPSPLAVRLAPGFLKALVRLSLPPEVISALGPAMEGLDFSFEAMVGLARDQWGKRQAAERVKVLVDSQIQGVVAALQVEGVQVESEQAAVATMLLETAISRTRMSSADALVESELCAARIANRLTDAVSAELRVCDGPVAQLTGRLLHVAAESLVRTAASRDAFLEVAVGAMLARARRVEGHASQIPGMYAYLRCALPHPDDEFSTFSKTFLDATIRRTGFLRLPGVEDGTVPVRRAVSTTAAGASVASLLAHHGRLLLLGPAGAGKSTQLVALAHALAQNRPDLPAQLRGRIPFFLPLRSLADRDFPDPRGLIAYAAPNFAHEAPAKWAGRVLRTGAVLICDGLDELPRGRRRDFFSWLRAFVRDFDDGAGVAVLLSSRPAAVRAPNGDPLVATREWPTATLDPLDSSSRNTVISTYALGKGADSRTTERTVAALHGNAALHELAANPLMACLLASAALESGVSSLPHDRANLCLNAAKALLQRPMADDLTLSASARFDLLAGLAAWFQENEQVVASLADVDAYLSMAAAAGPSEASTLRHALVESTGLLNYEGGGIAFCHRALQHSMAAYQVLRSARVGYLAGLAHRADWRDVVEDALTLSAGETRENLLRRLRSAAIRKPAVAELLARADFQA